MYKRRRYKNLINNFYAIAKIKSSQEKVFIQKKIVKNIFQFYRIIICSRYDMFKKYTMLYHSHINIYPLP